VPRRGRWRSVIRWGLALLSLLVLLIGFVNTIVSVCYTTSTGCTGLFADDIVITRGPAELWPSQSLHGWEYRWNAATGECVRFSLPRDATYTNGLRQIIIPLWIPASLLLMMTAIAWFFSVPRQRRHLIVIRLRATRRQRWAWTAVSMAILIPWMTSLAGWKFSRQSGAIEWSLMDWGCIQWKQFRFNPPLPPSISAAPTSTGFDFSRAISGAPTWSGRTGIRFPAITSVTSPKFPVLVRRDPILKKGLDSLFEVDGAAYAADLMASVVSDDATPTLSLYGTPVAWVGTCTRSHIVIPYCFPFLLVFIPTIIVWRRAIRIRPGYCVQCGYDLRTTTAPRCPECGFNTTAATGSPVPESRLDLPG